jgi:hypothetical protein
VYENRFFENAHIERYPVRLKKGSSDEFLVLECEYMIENLDNVEFVVMSESDDVTQAILNEQSNPFLKKVLISQFLPKRAKKLQYSINRRCGFRISNSDL